MTLNDLTKIPDEQRDQKWENDFFMALSQGNLKLLTPDPQQGPDGWPYLLVNTDESAQEPAQKIIQWLATKGMGLAVNPHKEYPDYIFSYGMIWHFKETGLFYQTAEEAPVGVIEIKEGTKLQAGPPADHYLPKYVRSILREFFRDQNVLVPKILVMSSDQKHYDLAFSLDSLRNPPETEHQGIAEAIGWFLPPHYSIMLVKEEGLPPFVDL
ncbi:hypothetical protein D3C87_88810 [compost metagenome]